MFVLLRLLLPCMLLPTGDCIPSVQIVLPAVVASGSSTTMLCLYDLQRAPLYSVKWYRGNFEFYRFVPKDQPPKRAFYFPGLVVNLSSSNDKQVTLVDIPLHLSGGFTCEVSADAPSFTTNMAYAELAVIDMNSLSPEITVEKKEMSGGYFLDANCTSRSADFQVTITFFINNRAVANEYVDTCFNSASLHLNMSRSSVEERFSLKCVASVLNTLHAASNTVTVCHQLKRLPRSGTSLQQLSVMEYFVLLVCQNMLLMCCI